MIFGCTVCQQAFPFLSDHHSVSNSFSPPICLNHCASLITYLQKDPEEGGCRIRRLALATAHTQHACNPCPNCRLQTVSPTLRLVGATMPQNLRNWRVAIMSSHQRSKTKGFLPISLAALCVYKLTMSPGHLLSSSQNHCPSSRLWSLTCPGSSRICYYLFTIWYSS